MNPTPPRRSILYWSVAVLLLALGAYLRFQLHRSPDFEPGFDEKVYVAYVERLEDRGITAYPSLFHDYVLEVAKADTVYLPPSRFGYIAPAWALTKIVHWEAYESLRIVSAAASWLFTLVGFLFARRWITPRRAIAVLAFLACDPLQIHLSQYAFIDSVAALWALVAVAATWESFREPLSPRWAVIAGSGAFALLLTKQEIAAFVGIFLFVALLLGKRFSLTTDRLSISVALASACLAAAVALTLLAGGATDLLDTFHIYLERSKTLPYAIATGDGPWHRYLLELLLTNPLVFLFALAGILRGQLPGSLGKYWLIFLAATYAIMCYGMNLRYTAMWDFPLALFAVAGIASLTLHLRRPTLYAALLAGLVSLTALRQYGTIFRQVYDPDPRFMLQAVRILK